MDVMHSCRCCLRSHPDKDLTTPYTHHGKTEIYYDMMKECFDIRLVVGGSGSCGICLACVGRLRDASNFKLQVQRSQAELQGVLFDKAEPAVKSELTEEGASDSVFDLLHVELVEKPEMIEKQLGEILNEDPLVKPTASDRSEDFWTLAVTPPGQLAARAKEQLSRITLHQEKKHVKRKKETKKPHNTFTKQTSCKKGNKLYVCETCGKQCNAKYLLIRHIKTHMPREGYPCKICNKTLLTHWDLQRHQLIHKGEKRYTCEECNLKFTQKGNLDRHRRIHTGERPFVCDECDKQFANKSNLDRHKKLHTGDRPYMCEKCTKRFTQKGNLRIHKCSVYSTG